MRGTTPLPAGFTLMELLITVALIAILAGIAVPQFGKTVERNYRDSARDILLTIYAGEQVYHTIKNSYYDPASANPPNWRPIYMDNPNVAHIPITYSVSNISGSGTSATFTATAVRNRTTRTMTLNQRREWCGVPGNNDPNNCPSWPRQ